jgi:hypothetical protein
MQLLKQLYPLTSLTVRINRMILIILVIGIHVFAEIFKSSPIWLFEYLKTIIFWSWIFSIGYTAQQRLTKDHVGLKNYNLFYSGILIILIFSFLEPVIGKLQITSYTFYKMNITWHYDDLLVIAIPLLIIHLFVLGFAAKAFVSAQKKEIAGVGDHLIGFVLLFAYPIGIFFLQPNIQEMIRKNESEDLRQSIL